MPILQSRQHYHRPLSKSLLILGRKISDESNFKTLMGPPQLELRSVQCSVKIPGYLAVAQGMKAMRTSPMDSSLSITVFSFKGFLQKSDELITTERTLTLSLKGRSEGSEAFQQTCIRMYRFSSFPVTLLLTSPVVLCTDLTFLHSLLGSFYNPS